MFTSRAEYRLLLREDNADLRLTPVAREMGLVDDEHWSAFIAKRESVEREQARLERTVIQPNGEEAKTLAVHLSKPLSREYSLADLIRRPELGYAQVAGLKGEPLSDERAAEQVETQLKYAGYIERQQEEIDRLHRHEATALPADLDYDAVPGLSNEIRQKLASARPETLARAGRISGVTPAALSLLLVYLKRSEAQPARSEAVNG